MNIFQKRHRILEKHRGDRFTPAQLKAEFLNTFPDVNPSSINAADCFNTPSKKAGCTCNECTRLGGFAVNRDGIVDMGASDWSGISSVYTPTGRTRAGTQAREQSRCAFQPVAACLTRTRAGKCSRVLPIYSCYVRFPVLWWAVGKENILFRVFDPTEKKLNLKLNFQVLRRTAATFAQHKGSVKDVQSLLRHREADTSANLYMQAIPESARKMVNSVYEELMKAREANG